MFVFPLSRHLLKPFLTTPVNNVVKHASRKYCTKACNSSSKEKVGEFYMMTILACTAIGGVYGAGSIVKEHIDDARSDKKNAFSILRKPNLYVEVPLSAALGALGGCAVGASLPVFITASPLFIYQYRKAEKTTSSVVDQ